MFNPRTALILAAVLAAAPLSHARSKYSEIQNSIAKLTSLSATDRPAATVELAKEIRALPAGSEKLQDADKLSQLVVEGDQGHQALQAVGDVLRQALDEKPEKPKKEPPMPYMDLARLVRYEDVSEPMTDPNSAKAMEILKEDDADIGKVDFTLSDLQNREVTLSKLRGKIIMINFWTPSCVPCRPEMENLNVIQTHFGSQGVVVLSISEDKDTMQVAQYVNGSNYHPDVLLDPYGEVARKFHVTGLPRTFVFNREGQLAAESVAQQTQRQFLEMLLKAGVQM